MIDQVKKFIEAESFKISRENPFFQAVQSGKLTKQQLIKYLHNLKYIFQNTTAFLGTGAKKADEMGLRDLAVFMREKIGEEKGHDAWAKDDLKKQGVSSADIEKKMVSDGAENLVQFVKATIQEDPRLFLGYMVFVEYFTILLAPEFLKNLERKCGIPSSDLSAIANHEQADKAHTQEDLDIIARFVSSDQQGQFFSTLRSCSRLIGDFLTDCAKS